MIKLQGYKTKSEHQSITAAAAIGQYLIFQTKSTNERL